MFVRGEHIPNEKRNHGPHHVWRLCSMFCKILWPRSLFGCSTACLVAPQHFWWPHSIFAGPTACLVAPQHVWQPHSMFGGPTLCLVAPQHVWWPYSMFGGLTLCLVAPQHFWQLHSVFGGFGNVGQFHSVFGNSRVCLVDLACLGTPQRAWGHHSVP